MARQGASLLRRLSSTRSSISPFLYITSRSMSRLFVGGLSFTTEEEGLRTAFNKFGEVLDAKIVKDRETGRSRGFGFVTFMTDGDAETAMNKMSGQFLDGRVIRVDKASPRPAPPPPPPRLSNPVVESPVEPVAEDWGTITSPMAAVPQNSGFVSSSSPAAAFPASTTLPDLTSLASASPPPPPPPYTPPPTPSPSTDTGPSFNFIDLNLGDLPRPDPNHVPRRRPTRLRSSSMADYEFGYYMSESSKFPFNTSFDTGIPRSSGPEFDFDFDDIKKANAVKQEEWKAAKMAAEEEEARKKAAEEEAKKAAEEEAKKAAEEDEAAKLEREAGKKGTEEEECRKDDKKGDEGMKEGEGKGEEEQRKGNVESESGSGVVDGNVDKGDETKAKESTETVVIPEDVKTLENTTSLESAPEASNETPQESQPPSSTDAPHAAFGS